MDKTSYVYILASNRNGTLYTGITTNLRKRIWQHKNRIADGFTTKYSVNQLVFFEQHQDISSAIQREKQIKKWRRAWKIALIERSNPSWKDLYREILQ